MSWVKLVSHMDIKQGIKPQFIQGRWKKPQINGRRKAELRKYFRKAGVPWIYEKPRPEVQINSPYNRPPKGKKSYFEYENRLADMRYALSQTDKRDYEMREQLFDKNKLTNPFDKKLRFLLPFVLTKNLGDEGVRGEGQKGKGGKGKKKKWTSPTKDQTLLDEINAFTVD